MGLTLTIRTVVRILRATQRVCNAFLWARHEVSIRLLESQKRVSESAEALSIRQAGESSIIASISSSVTASMNEVLRWVYWWHSTEGRPEDITPEHIKYELNTDFDSSLLSATEIQALVAAWQSGAISRDTLLHNLRTGEILPSARTNEQELELIRKETRASNL